MSFAVIYRETSVPALRRIRDADKDTFARVRRAIKALAEQPYPDSAVPWGGSAMWRLHAGDIRILYEVDEQAGAVYILNVGRVS
jgi:mRNA-degrading endonuclease RelE of RelBE toxin-antitoxin system